MLVGAAVYAEAYPAMKTSVLTWGDFGKVTLAQALHVSPWVLIPLLTVGFIGLFRFFEKKRL